MVRWVWGEPRTKTRGTGVRYPTKGRDLFLLAVLYCDGKKTGVSNDDGPPTETGWALTGTNLGGVQTG